MHRTFATSTMRKQVYLDGTWEFVIDPEDIGVNDGWYRDFPNARARLTVPGVWNTHASYSSYEGVAWYRTSLSLGKCRAVAIHFAAVTHQANVWLDGEPLGEHYGSFLPFCILLSEPEPGQHELVVRVDNTHDMISTIPSAHLDWFRYGGIPRPVWVEDLQGPGYIASLRLVPVLRDGVALLQVRAEIANLADRALDDVWTLYVEEKPLKSESTRLEPRGDQVLRFAVEVEGPEVWSPEDPRLYFVRLSFAGDDLVERTGFREIQVVGPEILLNGEPLYLKGVNRYEDHPDWGDALPQDLMLRDLELLRNLGANAIWGCHYPSDQRMLDLCDEHGILFVEETPLWGFAREQLALNLIAARASAMAWGMVDRDANHPCIWAWSLLSDCATDVPEGCMVVEELAETVREVDPIRPVTYASSKHLEDTCFDLVDVVCVNGHDGHGLTWPEYLDEMRAIIGDKPLIVSEFGAEAIRGRRALMEEVIGSEEYQRNVLTESISYFMEREDLAGFFIWQLFDTRADSGDDSLRRPRGYDNRGLLDEYRRPKLAYDAVRELLAERRRCWGLGRAPSESE